MKVRTFALTFLVAWFGFAGIAFAAQAAAPPAAAPAATSAATSILLAAVNGGIVAILGWLAQRKQSDGSHEDFDPVQLVMTAIVGALIGLVAYWRKKSFMDVETWVENSGLTVVAELGIKAIWRNSQVKLASILASLKAGAAQQNPTPPAPPTP